MDRGRGINALSIYENEIGFSYPPLLPAPQTFPSGVGLVGENEAVQLWPPYEAVPVVWQIVVNSQPRGPSCPLGAYGIGGGM